MSTCRMRDRTSYIVAVAAIGIAVLWLVLGLAPILATRCLSDGALIGDSFGLVNALFSALAFGGVVIAILLQRKDLSIQQEELELTRGVLEKQATSQNHSMEALERQAVLMHRTALLSSLTLLVQSIDQELANLSTYDKQYARLRKEREEALSKVRDIVAALSSDGING